jgi:hypothetical protein
MLGFLASFLMVAYPFVSIHMRTKAAYRFACEIVPKRMDLPSIEQRLRKPKAMYDNDSTAQAPDWIQAELSKVTLPNGEYTLYLFAYEGLPYFQAGVVYEDTSRMPFLSIVWGMNQVRVTSRDGERTGMKKRRGDVSGHTDKRDRKSGSGDDQ